MNIIEYCNHLYNFSYIPIYYYVEGRCVYSISVNPEHIRVPETIEKKLLSENITGDVYETGVGAYYGRIQCRSGQGMLIAGPVRQERYTESDIRRLEHECRIEPDDRGFFEKQLELTPTYSLVELYHLLSMIQMSVGEDETALNTFESVKGETALADFLDEKHRRYDEDVQVNIIESNGRFAPYIKEGNLEGLIMESQRGQDFNLGEYSSDKRENQLVIMIMALTLALKAVTEGGMPEKEGYSLIRFYIEQALKAKSAAEIDAISMKATMALVEHMRDYLDSGIRHTSVYDCIQYIRTNLYSPISVRDVAAYSGYSTEYFSRLFKKEIGFGAQEFIYNCKLIEAKSLLKSTGMSVGEISEVLYFSNQSHFQRRFKEKYGMTPREYRESDRT